MRRIGLNQAFIALFLCALLIAAGTTSVFSLEDPYKVFTLENGLGLFIKEMPAAPVVAINIWIHVGSRNEKPGEEGFSHLIEHLLFKGTPTYPTGQLDKEIKKLGASQNAFTASDYTCYHVLGAKEHFKRLMELEADAVMNSLIDPAEFEKEKQVVIEELRMDKDDPASLLYNLTKDVAYTTHPYKHPIVGFEGGLASATRDSVFDYYKRYYTPPNMWVVVVGDIKADEVVPIVKATMVASGTPAPMPSQEVPAEPAQDRRKELARYGDIQQGYLNMVWHVPGIASPDNYVLDVIANLMGSGRSSRLYKTLFESEQLVSDIRASYFTSQDPSLFMVNAQMPQGNVRRVQERVVKLMDELKEGSIPAEEFDKVKQQIIADNLFVHETAENQAFSYGHYATLGKLPDADLYVDRIKQVTMADVKRVASECFVDWNLSVVSYLPKIATEAQKPEMLTLENGLKLILKENHAAPLVAMAIQVDAGGLREDTEQAGLANLTATTLLKGTSDKNAEQIAVAFESMGTRVSCAAQKSYATIKMQCLSEKFMPSLQLVLEILAGADFPESEFRKEQDMVQQKIKQQMDDLFPFTYYPTLAKIFPDSPIAYSALGLPDAVKNLRRSDASQFFKKHYIAQGMVISIVGDFFVAEMREKLVKMFGKLPEGKTAELKEPPVQEIEKPIEVTGQKNREQSQILVATRTFPRSDPRTPAMDVLKNILSGSMSSRLFTNLRDKDSLAYSVYGANVGLRNAGYFFATLSTAAAKTDTARTRLIEELEKIRKEGFSDEELEDAKKYILGQYALGLVDNISQADQFSSDEFFGVGFDYFTKYPDLIRNMKKEEVAKIAQDFLLGSGKYVVGITKP